MSSPVNPGVSGLTATLNAILTPVKTDKTSHPNRLLSSRRELHRTSRETDKSRESMQRGHARGLDRINQ